MSDESRAEIISQIKKHIENKRLDWAKTILLQELKKEVDNWSKNQSVATDTFIAHYTSAETIYSLLNREDKGKSKNAEYHSFLRLYNVSSLNDPNEGNYLKNEIKKTYEWLDSAKVADTDAFICSFVCGKEPMGDKLPYWQSYGADGLGCSIQLSNDFPREIFKLVQYGKDGIGEIKIKFKTFFELGESIYNKYEKNKEKIAFSTKFWRAFDKIKFWYKDDAYKDEKECRYIVVADTKSKTKIQYHFKSEGPYLRRYIEVEELRVNNFLATGSEIFVGPRVVNGEGMCKNLKELADQSKLNGPRFIPSKISYRKVW